VVVGTLGNGYYGAVFPGATSAPTVFQGVVNQNQVIFNGIPIVAPVTAGSARVFRITNIRADATQLQSLGGQQPVTASVAISSGPLLANPVQTVGFVYQGLSTVVRNAANSGSSFTPTSSSTPISLLQCGSAGLTAGAVLRFTEGFASAFKTRVATNPNAAVPYSGALTNTAGPILATSVVQNTPAQLVPASESGFVLPVSGGNTAGLADFGTRLKATFNNIPSNVNIFVTTTNVNSAGNTGVPASTPQSGSLLNVQNLGVGIVNQTVAALVTSETAPYAAIGGFLPLQSSSNNSGGVLLYGPLPVTNGTATAVWEILATNGNAQESAEFGVYYSFGANPGLGNATVSMTFAPVNTSTTSGPIPRFGTGQPGAVALISSTLCQTVLLYPFVTAAGGLDTGIAIANTTTDPFGTRAQSGTCDLFFYGSGLGTATNPATVGPIDSGTVYAESVMNLRNGFQGYVIARCNFQLAHGYGLVSDIGIRNWATGYVALVLPSGTGNRSNAGNALGIETLNH
jgi:hypothetical protein